MLLRNYYCGDITEVIELDVLSAKGRAAQVVILKPERCKI